MLRGPTCSFILFLLAPVPTLMILVANSTPMVCDERTLHSFLTKRCSKQDLVCEAGQGLASVRVQGECLPVLLCCRLL